MTWSSVFLRLAVFPFSLLIVCVSTEAIAVSGIGNIHAISVASGVEQAPTEDLSRSVNSTPHIMLCANLASPNVVVVQNCVEK
jgi:hypothetical protein